MSNERPRTSLDPEVEESLSALVDGELGDSTADRIRERLAGDASLSARLAAFEELDASLRRLPAPAVPSDLAVRLQRQLDTELSAGSAPSTPFVGRGSRTRAPRRRRVVGWLAAAAAAGLTLALVLGRIGQTPGEREGPIVADASPERSEPTERFTPSPVLPEPPEAVAPEAPAPRLAEAVPEPEVLAEAVPEATPVAQAIPERIAETIAEPPVPREVSPEERLLAEASTEDLEIALELDTLADLEILAELELLELMVALEDSGAG